MSKAASKLKKNKEIIALQTLLYIDRREQVPSLSGDPSPHTQKPPCVVLQGEDDHGEVDD